MANSADTTYHLIKESTAGTIPATPAWLNLEYIPGSEPQFTSDLLQSDALTSNRASAGAKAVNFRTEGGLQVPLRRSTAIDVLLESALSGTWSTNTLNAGTGDVHFTVERRDIEGATTLYSRYQGTQVSSMTIEGEYSGNITASFDLVGLNRTTATTPVTGATAGTVTLGSVLAGDQVTVTVAGLTIPYTQMSLQVSHTRTPVGQFGSTSASRIATGGKREVTLSLMGYRTDFSPETIAGSPVAVTIAIGSGAGNIYTISLPAVVFNTPANDSSSELVMVSLEGIATRPNAAGTDISITRS